MSDERVEMTRAAYDLPPNMQFTTVKEGTMKMLLHIDSNGVMTIGAGLSADEATQAAAKMLVDEFAKAHNTEIASLRAELSRLSALVAELNRTIERRDRSSETSRKFWIRAAKAALAGDTHELRNRVEFAESTPVEIVLSESAPAPPVSQLKDTTNADK